MTSEPEHENERLAALRAFGVLDTDPEQVFDELVQIAATVCETPMAAISLIDADRVGDDEARGIGTPGN